MAYMTLYAFAKQILGVPYQKVQPLKNTDKELQKILKWEQKPGSSEPVAMIDSEEGLAWWNARKEHSPRRTQDFTSVQIVDVLNDLAGAFKGSKYESRIRAIAEKYQNR